MKRITRFLVAQLCLVAFTSVISFQTLHQWLEHDHHHHHHHHSETPTEEAADDACDLCKIKCVAYEPVAALQLSFVEPSLFLPKVIALSQQAFTAFPWVLSARGP